MNIDSFTGRYYLLSNFYPCPVIHEGLLYRNNEGAYQAAKCMYMPDRIQFTTLKGADAKALGQKVNLREDWEYIKYRVMYEINKDKYSYPEMVGFLLGTGDATLIEGNFHHDNCWGDCRCDKCKSKIGQNRLGKILMEVRSNLRETT